MTALPPLDPRPGRLFHSLRSLSLTIFLIILTTAVSYAAPLGVTVSQLSGNLGAQYILESNPDRDALVISTSARLRRAQLGAAAANVTVRWRATLSAGGITIAQTSHTTVHPANGNHDEIISTSFELNPPGFLSDAGQHTLLLEVFHINDPAAPAFTLDDSESLSLLNFGHFSGKINFGSVQGTLASFGNPAPHYLGNAGWQLTVYQGALSSGSTFANSPATTALNATRNSTTGDLTVTGGSAEIDDGAGLFKWNGWDAARGPVLATATGIAAQNFRLTLPAGLGWRDGTSGVLRTMFRSETVQLPLTATLQPAVGSVSGVIPAGREFVAEHLPVAFTPPSWKFEGGVLTLTQPGTRFIRQARYAQEVAAAGTMVRSNDSCFQFLNMKAGSDLELRQGAPGGMTVTLRINAGDWTTHFPDGDVSGLASSFRVVNDMINPAASSLAANWIHLQYGKGCPQSGGAQLQGMRLLAPSLSITPQGGITATGNLATDAQFNGVDRHLEIGHNEQGQPVHETEEFAVARFYAPGFAVPSSDTPADFLLAEIRTEAAHALGYPGTPAYAAGLGLYAGFNFDYPSGMHVRSRTGGAASFDYEVAARRAYARWSGVSGVIQAQPAELPFQADIYGFAIGFTDWGFNFLSNEMRDTFIEGQVDLTGTPADFVQGMENVRISCCGNLEGFDIPEGEAAKRLGYWDNFEIRNSSARFLTPGACDDDRAVLSYATTVHINGLPGRKAGRLNFLNDGTMTRPNDPDFAPSLISLEPQSGVAGQYRWWPRGDAYFNNPHELPNSPGFMTAAGDLETPFFNLSTVRVNTTALPEVGDGVLTGFMHGDFLSAGDVDLTHRGTPAGMDAGQYRTSGAYRPMAIAPFFGKIGAFNFPVIHNLATGNFHSQEDTGADLWVAEFESRVARLNAELAHVRFGAEINGVVQMSLGNLIEEAAEYGAQGLAQVIGENITRPIKDGLLGFAETLDNRLEKLLGDAIDRAVDTVVDPLANALHDMEENMPDWPAGELDNTLDANLLAGNALGDAIRTLQNFEDGAGDIATVIGELNDRLGKLYNALDCLVDILDGNVPEHSRIGVLVQYALEQLELNPQVGEIASDAAATALQEVLSSADIGWLADARDALAGLRDAVGGIMGGLEQGQNFFDEIGAIFGEAADIAGVVNSVKLQIRTRLLDGMQGHLLEHSVEELRAIIKGAIRDRIFASVLSVNLQSILRARLGYLDTLINDAINTAMQALISVLMESLQKSNALDGLNSAFEDFTGALSYLKAARVNGEAIATSDRIRELGLQAEVEFSIPTPTGLGIPMSADALIKYHERVSDADTPCNGPAGAILPEVILRASGGTAVGFGLDSRATIALKFGFDEDYDPVGFAGAFQIDQSEFSVSGMGLRDFTGSMALGGAGPEPEYYLSAFAAGSFGAGGTSVDLEGGFFVGQTCSADVFAFYPNFPFPPGPGELRRGIVAHLGGKAPLTDAGCLFNVTVGAEIGGFAIGDGAGNPFYGGHLGGSVSGEALCLLHAGGSIDLGYGYGGGTHRFDGEAEVELKLGFEPFQITRTRSFHVEYIKSGDDDGDWNVDHP